jgi:hypothetical protein
MNLLIVAGQPEKNKRTTEGIVSMTIKVKDLIEWLETLDVNDHVYIDSNWMELCSVLESEARTQIGGINEEFDEEFEDE